MTTPPSPPAAAEPTSDEQADAHIRAIVDQAPPLSEDQKIRLATLLQPALVTTGEPSRPAETSREAA